LHPATVGASCLAAALTRGLFNFAARRGVCFETARIESLFAAQSSVPRLSEPMRTRARNDCELDHTGFEASFKRTRRDRVSAGR
jgi:hypothetical protein